MFIFIYRSCGSDGFQEPPQKRQIQNGDCLQRKPHKKNYKQIKTKKMRKNYTYQPSTPKAGKVADKGCDTLNGCGMYNSVS